MFDKRRVSTWLLLLSHYGWAFLFRSISTKAEFRRQNLRVRERQFNVENGNGSTHSQIAYGYEPQFSFNFLNKSPTIIMETRTLLKELQAKRDIQNFSSYLCSSFVSIDPPLDPLDPFLTEPNLTCKNFILAGRFWSRYSTP